MAITRLKYEATFPNEEAAIAAYEQLNPQYPDIMFRQVGNKLIYWGSGSFLHGVAIDSAIKKMGGIA